MLRILRKQLAFVRRSFRISASYKLEFALGMTRALLPLFAFYFIGRLIGSGSPSLQRYGGDYFAFAFLGVTVTEFLSTSVGTFADSMQRAQVTGVLEATLSSRTSPRAVVLYDSTYGFLAAMVLLLLAAFVGIFLLDVDFSRANLLAATVASGLAVLAFAALGILSATVLIVFKKGDPVSLLTRGGALLSGAYFPLELLPDWLRGCAMALPMTHALEAMRLSLLLGKGISELQTPLLVLAVFGLVLGPISLWLFGLVVEKGRRDGTLLHY